MTTEPRYAAQGTKRRVKAQVDEPAAEASDDFMKIETAPKDGTRITIRMEGGDEFEARWRPTRLYHRETMHWIESGYWIQADNQAIRIAGEAVGWKR